MITIDRVYNLLRVQFGPPFLPEGHVDVKFNEQANILSIKIGRRDVQIDRNGFVLSAGTDLTEGGDTMPKAKKPSGKKKGKEETKKGKKKGGK